MQIFSNYIGHASGSTGKLIFQTYHGKTHVRKKPEFYHYPDTEEQQKTQAIFYNLQHPFQQCYRILSPFIPAWQRHNTNAFNVIGSAVYAAAQSYPRRSNPRKPEFFGVDKYNNTQIITTNKGIEIEQNTILFKATIKPKTTKKRFKPTTYHLFIFNVTTQQLIYTYDQFTNSTITAELSNVMKWTDKHFLKTYIALSQDNYITNFYLN